MNGLIHCHAVCKTIWRSDQGINSMQTSPLAFYALFHSPLGLSLSYDKLGDIAEVAWTIPRGHMVAKATALLLSIKGFVSPAQCPPGSAALARLLSHAGCGAPGKTLENW